ncbi:hypothetical protein V6255_06475 [Psychromonas arctica]|uniref:Uncharacterized protein n=1 Tax=Psychromonas arctica TaxID=168275 RepID=A0ABU9HA76_9GAMM
MKKIFNHSIILSLMLAFSQVVQAHPGHDHAHWASNSIHLLTVAAIASVIVAGLVYKQVIRRRKNVSTISTKGE